MSRIVTYWKVLAALGAYSIAHLVLTNPESSSPIERPPAPAQCWKGHNYIMMETNLRTTLRLEGVDDFEVMSFAQIYFPCGSYSIPHSRSGKIDPLP